MTAPNSGQEGRGDRSAEAEETEGPVIRDRRRIDPDTGELRDRGDAAVPGAGQAAGGGAAGSAAPPAGPATGAGPAGSAETDLRQQVAERVADLQRVQAEFVNYKRRVERDRNVARDAAVGGVLTELLPVMDDIGRAREHGELEGGFKAVAEALEAVLTKVGLERYGEEGDTFDPRIHEALMHSYSEEVDQPTCIAILQPGYRLGERVLRAARVAVAEPSGSGGGGVVPGTDEATDDSGTPPGETREG